MGQQKIKPTLSVYMDVSYLLCVATAILNCTTESRLCENIHSPRIQISHSLWTIHKYNTRMYEEIKLYSLEILKGDLLGNKKA